VEGGTQLVAMDAQIKREVTGKTKKTNGESGKTKEGGIEKGRPHENGEKKRETAKSRLVQGRRLKKRTSLDGALTPKEHPRERMPPKWEN